MNRYYHSSIKSVKFVKSTNGIIEILLEKKNYSTWKKNIYTINISDKIPYSGLFSWGQIFAILDAKLQEGIFAGFIFCGLMMS